MISAERKNQLANAGYYVEDMGAMYGTDWAGQYRWMNTGSHDFQDHDTSNSEDEAWALADKHHRRLHATKLTPSQIEELAEDALNAACLCIQQKLEVESGDLAGIVFSGYYGESVKQAFVAYIRLELHDAWKGRDAL